MIMQTNGSKMCIWRDSRDFDRDIAQNDGLHYVGVSFSKES